MFSSNATESLANGYRMLNPKQTVNTRPSSEPLQPAVVRHSQCPKFRLSRVFWTRLVLLILGTGPLATIILLARLGVTKDLNPNPIGFGLLAFLTFWSSMVLVMILRRRIRSPL
jgi:hypothetical protein